MQQNSEESKSQSYYATKFKYSTVLNQNGKFDYIFFFFGLFKFKSDPRQNA